MKGFQPTNEKIHNGIRYLLIPDIKKKGKMCHLMKNKKPGRRVENKTAANTQGPIL